MVVHRNLSANEKGALEKEQSPIDQLYPGLQRYARFLTRNKWDADDLAQETVLKAIQSYHPSEVSSALMNKIAYHHWVDTHRKKKHDPAGTLDDVTGRDDPSKSDRLLDTVQLLLDKLTPKQAVIFMLKEAFRFQAREIADLMGTTETAVKASLFRAKKRFEKDLPFQSVDAFWSNEDKELLFELLYQSLQAEDPFVLIDCISKIPSLAEVPKLTRQKHSCTPLNFYCMAA
jgi:RNA polymerase sigma-70 factor (ECF subfamily)